jgi:hypothetical protein
MTIFESMLRYRFLTIVVAFSAAFFPGAMHLEEQPTVDRVVVEDFRQDAVGAVPTRWKVLEGRQLRPAVERAWTASRSFRIVREQGRQFVRAETRNAAARIIMPNDGDVFTWNLNTHPRLSWDWRAHSLPEGAREDRVNDTGGAVYVTFDIDWLGRPRSIKYTYSSTLPVGTVVGFGRLQVIVVSSGAHAIGRWIAVERDIQADFRQVFRGDPPVSPLSIALWSDSDNTGGFAQVDFDNIAVQSMRR